MRFTRLHHQRTRSVGVYEAQTIRKLRAAIADDEES